MATTHNVDDDNIDAGTWFDDYGRVICKWTWTPATKMLAVQCGANGKRLDLSRLVQSLDDETLRKRLPQLAVEVAESITGTKYDV